ncbi:alpha-hydroxy acid oxidase [Leucobacter sp. HY1908]
MKIHSIEDLRRVAHRRLPKMVSDFLYGGALDELTLDRNRAALDEIMLQQRVMVDIAERDTSSSVFGTYLGTPLIVSPMGLLTLMHPKADVAIARAAAKAESIFTHSPWSGCSLEEVVEAAPGRVWSQIAFWKDEAETERHIDRAKALGVDTLVIAGDVAESSKRDRDLRHGIGMPPKPPFGDVINVALHPRWLWNLVTGRPMTFGTYSVSGRRMRMREMDPWMAANENPSATWTDIARLRKRWSGQILVKGVMGAADANTAMELGLDGVFVSNHGGRQFDSQPATIEALPEVADAVNGRGTVVFDSGVRRGTDIAKALALGADVVSAGRPFAYGLAASAGRGAAGAFDILTDELRAAMGFLGATRIPEITADVLRDSAAGRRGVPVSPPAAVGRLANDMDHSFERVIA